MSHTTTISSLLLADKAAIEASIAELKSKGVNVDLLENVVPRAYYDNQLEKADMVIKVNDGRYDVGLYKNSDGNYEAKADFWGGDIERSLGVTAGKDDNKVQAKLGKFYSTYAAHAAMRKAIQQGYQVNRSDGADGSIQLTINT